MAKVKWEIEYGATVYPSVFLPGYLSLSLCQPLHLESSEL